MRIANKLFVAGMVMYASVSLAQDQKISQAITAENWIQHPRILVIRNLYNDIQARIANKKIKSRRKDYSSLPRSCRGVYPIEYLMVSQDERGRVWQYTVAQRISDDALLTRRNYYDDQGRLRFVYMTNELDGMATIENRIYVDEQGKVFWDVKTEAGKSGFGEITEDSWMVQITTNAERLEEFETAKVECKNSVPAR